MIYIEFRLEKIIYLYFILHVICITKNIENNRNMEKDFYLIFSNLSIITIKTVSGFTPILQIKYSAMQYITAVDNTIIYYIIFLYSINIF